MLPSFKIATILFILAPTLLTVVIPHPRRLLVPALYLPAPQISSFDNPFPTFPKLTFLNRNLRRGHRGKKSVKGMKLNADGLKPARSDPKVLKFLYHLIEMIPDFTSKIDARTKADSKYYTNRDVGLIEQGTIWNDPSKTFLETTTMLVDLRKRSKAKSRRNE
jgi:hypothetical protein